MRIWECLLRRHGNLGDRICHLLIAAACTLRRCVDEIIEFCRLLGSACHHAQTCLYPRIGVACPRQTFRKPRDVAERGRKGTRRDGRKCKLPRHARQPRFDLFKRAVSCTAQLLIQPRDKPAEHLNWRCRAFCRAADPICADLCRRLHAGCGFRRAVKFANGLIHRAGNLIQHGRYTV